MKAPRETIYQALFSLVSPVTWTYNSVEQKFVFCTRGFRSWDQVNSGQQPAFLQRELRESTRQDISGIPNNNYRAQLWFYLQTSGNTDAYGTWPSQLINPLLDAVEAAILGPVPGEAQTLCGLVENAFIDGDIIIDDPVMPDQQIVVMVPISMTLGL